jgi:hypothetical protein
LKITNHTDSKRISKKKKKSSHIFLLDVSNNREQHQGECSKKTNERILAQIKLSLFMIIGMNGAKG